RSLRNALQHLHQRLAAVERQRAIHQPIRRARLLDVALHPRLRGEPGPQRHVGENGGGVTLPTQLEAGNSLERQAGENPARLASYRAAGAKLLDPLDALDALDAPAGVFLALGV